MRNRDWSLVFFTSLAQMSIGIMLCVTWLGFVNTEAIMMDTGINYLLLSSLGLITLATVFSFLHLGTPSNATNAMNNLAGSWLSREILAISLYALLLLVLLVMFWLGSDIGNRRILLLISALSGLALLWMMSRIYMIPTIPPWNNWYTPASFILTTLCLGLAFVLLTQALGFIQLDKQTTGGFVLTLTTILVIEMGTCFTRQARLREMNTGIDRISFDRGAFFRVYLSRMGLLAATILILLLFPAPFADSLSQAVVCLAILLVFAQAVLGRLLFYASYFRVGL